MDRMIRVTGKGKVSVKPDMIQLGIEAGGVYSEYYEAVKKSAKETALIRNAISAAGIDSKGLKTDRFSVNTEYENYQDRNNNWKRRFAGYKYEHAMHILFPNDNKILGKVLYELSVCPAKVEFSIRYTRKKSTYSMSSTLVTQQSNDHMKNVRYSVDGVTKKVQAFCLQSNLPAPASKTTYKNYVDLDGGGDERLIRKGLFYMYGGPAFGDTISGINIKSIMTKGGCSTDTDYYGITHYTLGYIYTDSFGGHLSNKAKDMIKDIKADLKKLPDPGNVSLDPLSGKGVYSEADGCYKSGNFKFSGYAENTATISLEAGVTLHNVTKGTTGSGAVTISGGDTFYLTAAAGTGVVYSGKYSVTTKYPIDYHACALKFSGYQDIGFAYSTGGGITMKVDWPKEAIIKIIKKDNATGVTLAGAIYGLYYDAACTRIAKQFPATDANGASQVIVPVTQATMYIKEIKAPDGYYRNDNSDFTALLCQHEAEREILGSVLGISDWYFVESGDVRGFVPKKALLTGNGANDIVLDLGEEEAPLAKELISPEDNRSVYYTLTSVKSASSGIANDLCKKALSYVGTLPYVYGGTSLIDGCDCSGFAWSIYSSFGINLPRTAQEMGANGQEVDGIGNAKPGDIVYYASGPHVGIYLGDGKVVQCSGNETNTYDNPGPGPEVSSADYMPITSIRRYLIVRDHFGTSADHRTDDTPYTKEQLETIWAIVAQEDNGSYEGALAVISSAMNRTESARWGYEGCNAYMQLTASGQYCYSMDSYWVPRLHGNVPEYVKEAVNDCLKKGVRNHAFTSFRSRRGKITGSEAVQIGGNWYFGS